jgi:hypothetical protein
MIPKSEGFGWQEAGERRIKRRPGNGSPQHSMMIMMMMNFIEPSYLDFFITVARG